MLITMEQAVKYAAYRERFLGGTNGVYRGQLYPDCDLSGSPTQPKDKPVQFLRRLSNNPKQAGSYLHVDELNVNYDEKKSDALEMEASDVLSINHGDNILYSSYVALSFVCEYVITLNIDALLICSNILLSFDRLGSYQKGLNELGESPWGFMLRSDAIDAQSENERICQWFKEQKDAIPLAPGYDQYCSMLTCLALIQRVLKETSGLPNEHKQLHDLICANIALRVDRVVSYLAGSLLCCAWKNDKNKTTMTPPDRGGLCHHASYPFAKIALNVTGRAIGLPLTFKAFAELLAGAIEQIQKLIFKFLDFASSIRKLAMDMLQNAIASKVRGALGDSLADLIEKVAGDGSIINQVIEKTTGEIDKQVVKPVVEAIRNAGDKWDFSLERVPIFRDLLSFQLHKWFSTACLGGDIKDAIFNVSLKDFANMLGISIPESKIKSSFEFAWKEDKPDWWPPGVDWPGIDVSKKIDIDISLPLNDLLNLKLPLGLIDIINVIISKDIRTNHVYLQQAAFLSNIGARTFSPLFVDNIDPVKTADRFDNSFWMALTYRFENQFFSGAANEDNRRMFNRTMRILDSAPETFPKAKPCAGDWNQDFRWIREKQAKNGSALYSGIDYMLPLMLIGSIGDSDREVNRATLIEAMSRNNLTEEEGMGPFKLPFQGPVEKDVPIFMPKAGGTQSNTVIYIGCIFDRTRGQGKVALKVPKLSGGIEIIVFEQDKPSKLVAVPLTSEGIVTEEINEKAKGFFLIASSE